MQAKSAKPKRWTSAAPESARNPKGSDECFLQAVEALGPFTHKTHEEADRSNTRNSFGVALSMQLAMERVLALACDYNGHTHQNAHAPRTKQVIERITKLESLAGELARYLEGLDDMTRNYLQTGGTGLAEYPSPSVIPLMEKAEYSRLPHPAPATDEDNELSWVTKLDALSRYATFCLKNFLDRKGIDDIDHADKGGNTNLIKEMAGSPEWTLVSGGWLVYDMFKLGEATGTEGGPFHSFLMQVFEFATGKKPEEAKLMPIIKSIVPARREYMEIVKRERALADELDTLEDEDGRCLNEDRAAEIATEQLFLHGQRLQLAAWFEPPNSRNRPGKEPRRRS